jgi:hypothetical protein
MRRRGLMDGWQELKSRSRSCSLSLWQLAHLPVLCALASLRCAKSCACPSPQSTTETEEREVGSSCARCPSASPSQVLTYHTHSHGYHKDSNAAEPSQSICSPRSLRPHIHPPRRTTIASLVLGPRPLASCVIRCFDLDHSHTVANTTTHVGRVPQAPPYPSLHQPRLLCSQWCCQYRCRCPGFRRVRD